MHVERTFSVPRPIEVVFDFLADFTHTEQWDPGTLETTRTAGDGGVGTTYHNRSAFLRREVELDYETVELQRPTRLVFDGHDGGSTRTSDSLTLTSVRDGTRTEIHYRADFVFSTWLNLVAPFAIKPKVEKIADETVARMSEVLTALPEGA